MCGRDIVDINEPRTTKVVETQMFGLPVIVLD